MLRGLCLHRVEHARPRGGAFALDALPAPTSVIGAKARPRARCAGPDPRRDGGGLRAASLVEVEETSCGRHWALRTAAYGGGTKTIGRRGG